MRKERLVIEILDDARDMSFSEFVDNNQILGNEVEALAFQCHCTFHNELARDDHLHREEILVNLNVDVRTSIFAYDLLDISIAVRAGDVQTDVGGHADIVERKLLPVQWQYKANHCSPYSVRVRAHLSKGGVGLLCRVVSAGVIQLTPSILRI
jgi:hypothetical protein